MKKILLLGAFLLSSYLGFSEVVNEDFSNWSDASYGSISTYTDANGGQWESNNALVNSTNGCSGSTLRLRDNTNSTVQYKGLDGNGKDVGIGDISFNYRHWDGDGSTITFQVQYNQAGLGWTNIGSPVSITTTTTCTAFSNSLELPGDDILIRIILTSAGERLMIDDFSVTDFVDPTAPISIASFDAKPLSTKSVSLDWITSSEENNEYFSIEHSTDGREFTQIDIVEGALNSTEMQYYSYEHKDAAKGDNYYRLRQVDTDGNFSFSEVEVVKLGSSIALEARPTLAKGNVIIAVNEGFDTEATIEVYNILGRLVTTEVLSRGETQVDINVNNLQKGHYMVKLTSGMKSKTTRFIKQ